MASRQISATTYSNQDISGGATIATYIADADRQLRFQVFLSGVAGDGDYVAYLTKQRLGAGTIYPLYPKTTVAAGASDTAFGLASMAVNAKEDDVIGVYVDGLAADTDVTVIIEIWEDDYPQDSVWTDTKAGYLDAAISGRAAPGDEMDLVDAPNATAVAAIQNGLSTLDADNVRDAVLKQLLTALDDTGWEGTLGQALAALIIGKRYFNRSTGEETLKDAHDNVVATHAITDTETLVSKE